MQDVCPSPRATHRQVVMRGGEKQMPTAQVRMLDQNNHHRNQSRNLALVNPKANINILVQIAVEAGKAKEKASDLYIQTSQPLATWCSTEYATFVSNL